MLFHFSLIPLGPVPVNINSILYHRTPVRLDGIVEIYRVFFKKSLFKIVFVNHYTDSGELGFFSSAAILAFSIITPHHVLYKKTS